MAKKAKELKPVGVGHNSAVSEDDMRKLHFANHVPMYEKALAAKKAADADFKNACKKIKADGGSIDDVKFTISLKTPEGEAKALAEAEAAARRHRWNNLPVGEQGTLDFDRTPIEERAFKDGEIAGLQGVTLNPPHQTGTAAYDSYCKGWYAGQASLAANFLKKTPEAELLRPESDPSESDPFDEAADGNFGDDGYRPGDEVDVEGEESFEPPAFLREDA